MLLRASLVTQTVKNLPAMWEAWVWSLGCEDPLWGGHGNPLQYSCLENSHGEFPWRIPMDPDGLQSMGLKTIGHNWATKHSTTQDVIQSTFCWFRTKEQAWGRGQIKINALWCSSFNQPKASLHTILLYVCFQALLFLWPWMVFWYMGLFLRTPIRVVSSNKGCLQLVFSSLQLQTQLQQWWSMEFRNLPLNLFLTHAHVAAVCKTGLLLWVTLILKHIHACLSASCGQLSWWKALPIWFLANMFSQPLSLPFFVNILSASWALP